ncbi:MAG: HIT domain-containing protein [Deltaproteobacteria bacterium]|nr:HIT domain-containing protein [Deltaproteobacteria bacterium]
MKQLWTPWRVAYIQGEKESGCVFCKAAKGPDAAKGVTGAGSTKDSIKGDASKDVLRDDDLVLHRSKDSVLLLNRYPYSNGHILIAPNLHESALEGLPREVSIDMQSLINLSIEALKKTYNPDGFNIGMNLGASAGAGIADHLHWHIVPRWNGDTNFMPVLNETKVIPEHLEASAEELRAYFKENT